ncbi:MAG: SagB family peptide dehydrogenase [Polyangiaceae bacterium]|nr:SagB family peptide dehydrogenase [Polyangiaceae bacterium]
MSLPYLLAFKDGISLSPRPEGGAALQVGERALPLPQLTPALMAVLQELSGGRTTAARLGADVERTQGTEAAARLFYHLERFKQLGLLTYGASWERGVLATLTPISPAHPAVPGDVDLGARYVLSRFACLRSDGEDFVLDSPLGHAKTRLHDRRAAAICHLLARPRSIEDICRELPELSSESVMMLLGLLLGNHAASVEGPVDEARARALVTWSFHDLLFHARSRRGRHAEPYGATFPFRGIFDALPPVKPPMAGANVPLRRPDIDALCADDIPFTRVLERRRSIRHYGERPIHVDALGELLYRAARVRAVRQATGVPYAHTDRPYPGGGACYELETYVAVHACEGLAQGLYHYRPLDHALTKIADRTPDVAALIEWGSRYARLDCSPQTLIVFSARFQRIMWKYESMGYAAILKDVGVLYQNFYLVATAMGLAPCALGGGDSDLFAAAAGLDYYEETSVGELLLGTAPET